MIDFHSLSDEHLHAAINYLETAVDADPDDAAVARELAHAHALVAIATAVRALDLSFQYAHHLEAAEEEEADGVEREADED